MYRTLTYPILQVFLANSRGFTLYCAKVLIRNNKHKFGKRFINSGANVPSPAVNLEVTHSESLDTNSSRANRECQQMKDARDTKEQWKKLKKLVKPNAQRVVLPEHLKNVFDLVLEKYPQKNLLEDSQRLYQHLWNKLQCPIKHDVMKKIKEIQRTTALNNPVNKHINENEKEEYMENIESQVRKELDHNKSTYIWNAVEYDEYKAAQYIYSRFAPDYSSLVRIFLEIQQRYCEFTPTTLLDFGSGVGTVIWAANVIWPKAIIDNLCVDINSHMLDMCQLIVQDGMVHANNNPLIRNIFYRHHIPSHTAKIQADLVVSAYSLLEIPTLRDRCNIIDSLWSKTTEGGILVFVENGTNAGYQCIMEARQYLLDNFDADNSNNEEEEEECPFGKGQILSPCPHHGPCGRYTDDTNTPCNFSVRYEPYALNDRSDMSTMHWLYSYLVVKKGEATVPNSWARIVREVKKRHKVSHCEFCMPTGELKKVVVAKNKTDRSVYRLMRKAEWGARVPLSENIDGPLKEIDEKL